MAASMNVSCDDIAKLLNLNQADSDEFTALVSEYFGAGDAAVTDSSSDGEDSANDEDTVDDRDEAQNFEPVHQDLAERIVPIHRGNQEVAVNVTERGESPTTSPPPLQATTIPCGCKGTPCHSPFSSQDIEDFRLQYLALERAELDICLLSKISCGIHLESQTRNSKNSAQTERKTQRTDYSLHGHKICRDFFKFIHGIGQDKLTALLKHYKAKGVEARSHKNSKRLPKHALSYEDTRRVVDFILNYAEIQAIHLPGRTAKHWITDIQLLPTSCTKPMVYAEYKAASEELGVRIVKLRTFQHLWRTLVPFVRTMPPASDLCWTCQQGATRLLNTTRDFGEALRELEHHQAMVKQERQHYIDICKTVASQLPADRQLGSHDHCSFQGSNHLSFDFAQQVHYPHNPLQPGPIYFKTPRKCGIFGVNSEGHKRQINYLIDEAHSCGKGANVVISLLHDFLENHSLGETHLYLHADNCAGQNKNSAMVQYLQWRCLTGRHTQIQLSFLLTGHTKFSPDAGFGLLKRKFRRTRVDCLDDIKNVVDSSSEMNSAKLVGAESGPSQVLTYDWSAYLSQFFVKVKQIKSFHHFTMNNSGTLVVKEYNDTGEQQQVLLKKQPGQNTMPPLVITKGLDIKRQWYLFKEIRPFVADHVKDVVAPLPNTPEHPASGSDSESDEEQPPAPKKKKTAQPNPAQRGRGQKQ
ncbi:hypothetical protein EGW08_001271 [Elysia chlorotica]|uniref:DUF7869 domain-containing protein n=1 Tax=Elysia chlorotica TaxID=188477 RepID=A0A433UAW6_ELYCH|nr:hypothetical protein EGW08_001271 [Elysia chlorotica]